MKKLLILVLLFIFAANNSFGSPLVFKVIKEVDTKDLTELASFDATKYRQIRIGIKAISTNKKIDESKYAQLIQKRAELTAKLQNLKLTLIDKHPSVIAAQNEIDKTNDEIEEINSLKSGKILNVSIFGVDGKDEILLFNFEEGNINRSIIVDSPPSKITVKVSGKGMYSLYVWGQ